MSTQSIKPNQRGWAYVDAKGNILFYSVARHRSQAKFNAIHHPEYGCARYSESWKTFKRVFGLKLIRVQVTPL